MHMLLINWQNWNEPAGISTNLQMTTQNIKHTAHLNHLLLENTSFFPVLGTLSRTSLSSDQRVQRYTGDWNTERIKDLRTRTLTCFKYPCKAYCRHHPTDWEWNIKHFRCCCALCQGAGCALRNRAGNNAWGYSVQLSEALLCKWNTPMQQSVCGQLTIESCDEPPSWQERSWQRPAIWCL